MNLTLQVENLGCSDQIRQALLKSVKLFLKTLISPKQAKPPEKFPINPTKGVRNNLWNISHKAQLVAHVPGSLFLFLVSIFHIAKVFVVAGIKYFGVATAL